MYPGTECHGTLRYGKILSVYLYLYYLCGVMEFLDMGKFQEYCLFVVFVGSSVQRHKVDGMTGGLRLAARANWL